MALTKEQNVILELTASALFSSKPPVLDNTDFSILYREAVQQAVLPLLYQHIKHHIPSELQFLWAQTNNRLLADNMRVNYEHTEVHDLMLEHNIPYVAIKGAASASYYPEPILRTMGDVDFLVNESDFSRTSEMLLQYGFTNAEDSGGIHVAFHRDSSVWELHRSMNGIPAGDTEKTIRTYLSDIIETSVEMTTECGSVRVPDSFHHGLVLLLHTASHLTSEGVGLRHLCDWAVFADSMSDENFVSIFETPLKECGLWHFAQILTLCCEKYLRMPTRDWTGSAEDSLLEGLICDIMDGGNFGHKDEDRYRQIKYISNRGNHTVDKKSTIRQLWDTIGKKAEAEKVTRLAIIVDYVRMIALGERKIDSSDTIKAAAQRKKLYSKFKLFER